MLAYSQNLQLETESGIIIANRSTVTVEGEMIDLMQMGMLEANLYVRNLTETGVRVVAQMKSVSGESQFCFGGSCTPVPVGTISAEKSDAVLANSAISLAIESVIMEPVAGKYFSRTVEVYAWLNNKPEEKISATITFTNNLQAIEEYRHITYLIDGQEYNKQYIRPGEIIHPIIPAGKEGYTFSGWINLPKTMPNEDIVIHGSYSINSYNLTFELDGNVLQSETLPYGSEIKIPIVPQKEGYTFTGWQNIPEVMPAKDVSVKGEYKRNSYTITYIVNGVVYNRQSVLFESELNILEHPYMDGYTFSGWDCTLKTMPAHDVTINGFFTINSYTLTFILNGEIYQQENKLYGTQIKIIDVPQNEGYTFSGWGDVPSTMPAKDLTLVGSYIVNKHTVTYYVDNEIYTSFEVDYGSVLTTLTDLTKIGHTFSGWSEMPETMPDHDVIVTGTFSANKYAVIYTLNGEAYATDSVFYGKNIVIRPNPELEGHTFSGWSKTHETMPAHDVTIRGEFVINTYKLTYILDGDIYNTMQISYGSPIYLITDPVREGYTFSGWSEVPETMPAQDVTVTGSFTVNGINAVFSDKFVDVYTLQGTLIKRQIAVEELEHELPTGIYIVNGKKMLVR